MTLVIFNELQSQLHFRLTFVRWIFIKRSAVKVLSNIISREVIIFIDSCLELMTLALIIHRHNEALSGEGKERVGSA